MGKFEWDKNKAKSNKKKHGVTFIEATQVFNDPKLRTKVDDRKNYGENRFNSVGRAIRGIFNVTWTDRDVDTVRIISARDASNKEKKDYNKK